MTATPENKAVLDLIDEDVGEVQDVYAYYDADEKNSIDLATIPDSPDEGVTAYATLGLADSDIKLDVDGKPLRTELLMVAADEFEETPNILASCALNIQSSGFEIRPGTIFTDVVAEYRPDSAMRHIFFVPPVSWELEMQEFDSRIVAFLQAIPISDAERDYADANGTEALEDLFEKHDIDLYDLDRASVA